MNAFAQNPFVFFLSLRIKCCSLVLSQNAHWEFSYTGKLTIMLPSPWFGQVIGHSFQQVCILYDPPRSDQP